MLRILAALLVVLGHSFPLTMHEAPTVILGNAPHVLGVKVFFVISGYLITGSWLNDPDLGRYYLRRTLRIMPGLTATVLLTIFVLGPAASSLTSPEYFSSKSTWAYLWNIALYPVYSLPGVFVGNPYPDAVNGSLWTIPVEVGLYLVAPIVLLVSRCRWVLFAAALLAISVDFYLGAIGTGWTPVFYGTPIFPAAGLSAYFMMGLLIRSLRLERPAFAAAAAAVLVASTLVAGQDSILKEASLLIGMPFLIVWLGRLSAPQPDHRNAIPDVSYGLYLYAFPTQQLINHLANRRIEPFENFVLALPLILGLAILSWLLVEKPALRLKPRIAPSLTPA